VGITFYPCGIPKINVCREQCSINKAIQDELLVEMDEEIESELLKELLREDPEDIEPKIDAINEDDKNVRTLRESSVTMAIDYKKLNETAITETYRLPDSQTESASAFCEES
jgi:hypothetical protein